MTVTFLDSMTKMSPEKSQKVFEVTNRRVLSFVAGFACCNKIVGKVNIFHKIERSNN